MKIACIVLCSLLFSIQNIAAQEKETHQKKQRKVQFTPIPYINYSQSQKLMYGAIGMATFRTSQNDSISPRSIAGASYVATARGSWFGNGFAKLFFKEDDWRLTAMAGTGNYNFQTYIEAPEIPANFYDYSSESTIVSLRGFRRVHKKNYLGLGYYYSQVNTQFADLPEESTLTSQALQLIYMNDSRNAVYFPTQGIRAMLIYTSYPKWLDNEKNFGILTAYFNTYLATPKNNVWALRAYAKVGTSDLFFQRQVVIGQVDLRGYTNGKYRGDGKFDLQAEYRWQIAKKLGLVGFGGLGTLVGSDQEDFNGKIYPSIGAGIRFKAVESTGMRFGLDVARGKDDWAFYFRLGEAF